MEKSKSQGSGLLIFITILMIVTCLFSFLKLSNDVTSSINPGWSQIAFDNKEEEREYLEKQKRDKANAESLKYHFEQYSTAYSFFFLFSLVCSIVIVFSSANAKRKFLIRIFSIITLTMALGGFLLFL